MNETNRYICTACNYIGKPHLSIGRLAIEFLANFLAGVGGVQLFDKVRHCPECGGHSMVPIESEAGQLALSKREANKEPETRQNQNNPEQSHLKHDDEYLRIRLQR